MSIGMNGLVNDTLGNDVELTSTSNKKHKKKADPMDTLIECIWDFVDAQYEDTDVTDADLMIAKKRFKNALQYLIITTMEQYDAKK